MVFEKYNNLYLKKIYPHLLIIVFILLVYIQNLWFDFAYLDDNLIVFAEYEKIDSLSKIPKSFLGGYLLDNYYRPMIMVSFIIDTSIAGQSSTMYHLSNVLMHIIFCLLLYQFLLKLNFDYKISLLVTIIFSIHPINVNAVSWIVGRNDLIAGFFSLTSFYFFILYNQGNKISYLLLHLFFFLLALFSKEFAIMIPLVIFAYLFLINNQKLRVNRKNVLFIVSWSIIISIYMYIRLFVAHIHFNNPISIKILLSNLYIVTEYIAKLVYLPGIIPLSIKNNFLIILGEILVLIFTIVLLISKLYMDRRVIFGLIFFIVFLIPPLLTSLKSKDGSIVYLDCRIYLPLVGFIILLAVFLENFNFKKKFNLIGLSFVIIILSVFNFSKGQVYSNGEKFWSSVTEELPSLPYHWIALGFYYYDNGQYLKAAQLAEKAIELNPTIDYEFYHKAALAYEKAGQLNKAIDRLKSALNLKKEKSLTLLGLIKNNLQLGNVTEAIKYLNHFKRLEILDLREKAEHYSTLAYYFNDAGLMEYSIDLMNQAVSYQPQNSNYLNDLGVFYYKIGKIDSARHFFYEALKLDPLNEDFQRNVNGLKNITK